MKGTYNSGNLGLRISKCKIHFGLEDLFFCLSNHAIFEHLCVGLSLSDIHLLFHFLEVDLGSNPSSTWVLFPTLELAVGS